jgi:hypothetical protein
VRLALALGLCGALLASASLASAEVAIQTANGRLDLRANTTPLSEVLEQLSRQTGMKVVYEGPIPRQLVTVSLERRTPAEAVLALLEGLGLNYALVMDPTGSRVQTLLMEGSAPSAPASAAPAAPLRPALTPTRVAPPPASSPDTIEEPEVEEPPAEDEPAANPQLKPGAPAGAAPAGVPVPGMFAPAMPPAVVPVPVPNFPISPFTPRLVPPTTVPGQPPSTQTPQGSEENPGSSRQ